MASSSPSSLPSIEERQKTALSDLSSLGRVSHRLALVDTTERLQTVLDKLLPRLLKRIGDNHQVQLELAKADETHKQLKSTHDKIHEKLVEMLGHTMKRVRDDKACQLPCFDILNLLLEEGLELKNDDEKKEEEEANTTSDNPQGPLSSIPKPKTTVDPFTLNLSLTFLTLGLPRCSESTQVETLLPAILVLLGHYSGLAFVRTPAKKMQSNQVAHLFLRSMEQLMQFHTNDMSSAKKKSGTIHDSKWMTLAREICQKDPRAAGALFDLLLDALLYQPVPMGSNIPPWGLSQVGHERLKQGNSTSARDWAAEKATRMKLMEFKLAILDFIAPSRRWAIFMGNKTASNASSSRTVALLVAASGDGNPEVAARATTYLKMYHDSFRTSTPNNQTGAEEESQEAGKTGEETVHLCCTLAYLALGQTNAESALSKLPSTPNENEWLGLPPCESNSSDSPQLVLSLKRRVAAESVLASTMSYIADKTLGEDPQIFNNLDPAQVTKMATICLLAAQRPLKNLRTSSGQTVLQAKAYLAASQLLNILCVRLSTYYDTREDTMQSDSDVGVVNIMSEAMKTACSVLVPASTQRPAATTAMEATASSMEGSVAIRDACYGVICSLCRSRFVLAKEGYIFARGEQVMGSDKVSIDTASLLFGCAANEVEVLSPRATAALDALLGAYLRVYGAKQNQTKEISVAVPFNPWANPVSDASISHETTGDKTIETDQNKVARALLPLMWAAGQSSQPKASRVASARWLSSFIKKIEVTSGCHLLCFLAGDSDVTAASIAREGLGLPSKMSLTSSDDDIFGTSSDEMNEELPQFSDFVAAIFPTKDDTRVSTSDFFRPKYWDFSFAGKATTIRFACLIACYNNNCLLIDLEKHAIKTLISNAADTLILFGSKNGGVEKSGVQVPEAIELLEECTRCLVGTFGASAYARSLVVKGSSPTESELSICLQDMEFLSININSSRARRNLSQACGTLYEDDTLWRGENGGSESITMADWLARTQVNKALHLCLSTLDRMKGNVYKVAEIHGAAFLGAQSFRAFRLRASRVSFDTTNKVSEEESSFWQSAAQFVVALGEFCLHSDEVISNACSDALAIAFDYDSIDAPILDARLYDSVASALGSIALALERFGTKADSVDAPRAAKIVVAAGKCLAASTSGAGAKANSTKDGAIGLGTARLTCFASIVSLLGSLAYRKDEEIALLVGEALALYADAYSPEGAVWSSQVAELPKAYDEEKARELPPFQQVFYVLLRDVYQSNSPHRRTACAPALLGVVGRAANGVRSTSNYSRRSLVKEMKNYMGEIQQVFISLLSHTKSKQLCRESCCLGVAACRGLSTTNSEESGSSCSTEELNHRLLRAFGQTTNYGGSAYQETREQAAQRRERERGETTGSTLMDQFGGESTEVGGATGLGESALTSYKEMAAAAADLGRHDVLYALLLLSVSHPVWFTSSNRYKYSATSLLGSDSLVGGPTNSKALQVALRPHLGKLLPRVLRARHDPNKQTREQMESLWVGLTGGGSESRAAITEYLLPTIDTLIDDCTSKFWRARAGACSALAEIIVGRSWQSLGGGNAVLDDDDIYTKEASAVTAGIRLLRLFRVSTRGLDDVRLNVRLAAETLARTIRGLSICLCNPQLKNDTDGSKPTQADVREHERNASAASATTLRWLIKHGLNQQCPEATGICLSCLVQIVDVVKPKILQPLIPDLLKSLLSSMSALEPAALNYLQARSGAQDSDSALSYDNLERLRLRMAQAGPLAAAVTKLLEMLPSVNIETQKEVVSQLDAALRESVGFATRAATADAVSLLCNSCPKAFQFPGASSTNPSVRLLRALYFASERERGQGARDKMVHALGNLAALCPGSAVRVLAIKSCNKYKRSTGFNDNPASRRASAASLRSIAVRASNQLADGGPKDIWFQRILPVAFLGKMDSDAKISSLFSDLWEEGCIAINTSHMSEGLGTVEELLLPHLVDECCSAIQDLSWTRRVSGANGLLALADTGLLSPAPRRVTGASATASLEREAKRAQASCNALSSLVEVLCRPRLWTGKSTLVDASVKICCRWVGALTNEDSLIRACLGWENESASCPWQPIVIAPGIHNEDLFVGDGWFQNNHPDMEAAELTASTNDAPSPEVDDTEVERIDFEECEKAGDESDIEELTGGETSSDDDHKNFKIVTFSGLVCFLASESMPAMVSSNQTESEEWLPYRVRGLCGLRDLLGSLDESTSTAIHQKRHLYLKLAPKLLSLCVLDKSSSKTENPPVILARGIDCLGSCWWQGINDEDFTGHEIPGMLELAKLFKETGGAKQPAWTVREAARLCLSQLAAKCKAGVLRDQRFTTLIVDCATDALKDRKFWKVRLAGLTLLRALAARAGTSVVSEEDQDRQLLLEAILPFKEDILSTTRKCLADPEAKVTASSSEIIGMMAWWP